jgi:hypothetical protein
MLIQASSQPSTYGIRTVNTKLMAQSVTLTTSATGFGFVRIPINFNGVGDYFARFGNAFQEVRILSAKVKLMPLTAGNGMSSFYWTENSSPGTTPTQFQVVERTTRDLSNSNGAGTGYVMSWRSTDLFDLSFDAIATPQPVAYFNMFTDPAFGTTPAVQNLWIAQIELNVQFRGIATI